tara:strand:- start:5460 stop:5789 length:330 start_codon:yes stop_codon:yes gene_type:complete
LFKGGTQRGPLLGTQKDTLSIHHFKYAVYLDDMKKIKNDSLVGEIYIWYSERRVRRSFVRKVDVDLEVSRMRDNSTGDMTTLFYKRGAAKVARIAENRAFRGLPSCVTK